VAAHAGNPELNEPSDSTTAQELLLNMGLMRPNPDLALPISENRTSARKIAGHDVILEII